MMGIKNAVKSRETTLFPFMRGPSSFVPRVGMAGCVIHEITDPTAMEFTAPAGGSTLSLVRKS